MRNLINENLKVDSRTLTKREAKNSIKYSKTDDTDV